MSKNSIYVLKERVRLLFIPCDIVVVLHRCVGFLQVFYLDFTLFAIPVVYRQLLLFLSYDG